MSSILFVQIPVQIGSNKLMINLNELQSTLTCKDFIELVLNKCKLNKTKHVLNTYALFEHVNGVERIVGKNENIIKLWLQWKNEQKLNKLVDVKFVIRKYSSIERAVQSKRIDQHQQHRSIQSYYKKVKLISDVHIDESITKKRKINEKIEILPDNVTPVHNDEEDHGAVDTKTQLNQNINFLKFIYIKLKQQNMKNYKLLINEQENTTITTTINEVSVCDSKIRRTCCQDLSKMHDFSQVSVESLV